MKYCDKFIRGRADLGAMAAGAGPRNTLAIIGGARIACTLFQIGCVEFLHPVRVMSSVLQQVDLI